MEDINSQPNEILAAPHTDYNSVEKMNSAKEEINNKNEKRNCIVNDETANKDTDVEMESVELREDDRELVVIEDFQNKIIEVDEDSNNHALEIADSPRPAIESQKAAESKATEFVVVHDANAISILAGSEKENVNRYPAEDVLIKDEFGETTNADLSTNDVLENDPMDLLELNNRSESTSSTRSQGYVEDYGDDLSTSSAQTGSSSTSSVLNWIKEYPWLLYEVTDDSNGYCLYCNTKINIKCQKTVKQHGLSLYHKERCENYLAFREEEEKNGLSTDLVEIKQEFGTDSYAEALKLKRKSQNEAFNNFNWRRWLKDCEWLKRDSTEGTIGYCKYCLVHLNVEFSYLRDRHQESSKHKEAEKLYDQNKQLKMNNEKTNESSEDKNHSKNDRWLEIIETEPHLHQMVQCTLCKTKMIKGNFLRHLRTNLHLNNEKIYKENQKQSDESILEDADLSKNQYNWKIYTKQHPWLICDPKDPKYAYCKYCEKRVIYGGSAAKRSLHENSSQHKYNENEYKSGQRKSSSDKEVNQKKSKKNSEIEEGDDEGDDEGEQTRADEDDIDEEDEDIEEKSEETSEEEDKEEEEEEEEVTEKEAEEEEEQEQNEEEDTEEDTEEDDKKEKDAGSEDENDSKKRIYRLTDEWLNQYAWCKKYNKDPTNFFFCIYCKIPLRAASSRPKHQTSAMHIAAEEEYLKRQGKKQKLFDKKQNIGNDDQNYEWSMPLKGNINMYSCKYCRVRISKHYSKKSHAASRIHQINESIYKSNRRKPSRQEETNSGQAIKTDLQPTNISTSKKEQTFAKVIIKVPSTTTLIRQWQKKFPWLSYKRNELRSNYGFCTICDCSLYLRSLKHVLRHVRSGRHVRLTKEKKKQKLEQEHIDANKGPKQEIKVSPDPSSNRTTNSTNPTAQSKIKEFQKNFNYRSTIIEMKKRFSWIESSEKANYGFCRFCNTDIPLKILFLRNHSNSQKHRFSVKNYSGDGQRIQSINNEAGQKKQDDVNKKIDVDDDADDDVMIVEEENEEILISEQDENWTVKSETMDEHEELDFLLQRSIDSSQNKIKPQRNIRKSTGAEEHPLPKRIKLSQSFRRLNDSNTSLVASLLNTPLTLASCLGPIIQQQIQQQQANSQQTLLESAPTSITPPQEVVSENTFDLFFKSVSETMKKLPVDIAAEGKVRVMQIICDLELQALKRQEAGRTDFVSSNASDVGYQPVSTSQNTQLGCNSTNNSSISNNNDLGAAERNFVANDTIITQVNIDSDASTSILLPSSTSAAYIPNTEKLQPTTTTSTSPIIGVMDKNAFQTIQLKTSAAKQIPRTTCNTTVTTMANTGIRCIPFKNLSQPIVHDQTNAKISRIQVPLNVTPQSVNTNSSPSNTSKNVINFRNIQITKRIAATPTSTSSVNIVNGVQQHQHHHQQQQKQIPSQSPGIINKSPQRTFITNMQPQMQRWSCSVNGVPPISAVNQLSQLPPQQTSTPVVKRK